MKAKMYIINELGWEYNDEYYYRSGSGGGAATEAYTDYDLAIISAQKKTAAEMRERFEKDALGYVESHMTYGGNECFDLDPLWVAKCKNIYNIEFKEGYNDIMYPTTIGKNTVVDAPDDFYIEFADQADFKLFEVTEVVLVA